MIWSDIMASMRARGCSVQTGGHHTRDLASCGKTMLARENFDGPHVWHNRRTFSQDAQKGRPARPQRVKTGGVPSGAHGATNKEHHVCARRRVVRRSRYNVSCSTTALLCDDSDRSAEFYAGTMIGNFWGVELGYLNMGRIARESAETRAQGMNLSLVGKAQLTRSLRAFGKVGSTYGRSESAAIAASSMANGSEQGFGLSYGAGVSYDFTPRLSATLELDSNDFRFAGGRRDPVRSTSLGLQYRY